MVLPLPADFITPCLPSKATQPPFGPDWAHEIKHDGYRLMLCRDSDRVRCFTKNSHDWADRFPAIVEAALRISATSFLIDGEAAILGETARRTSRHYAPAAVKRCCWRSTCWRSTATTCVGCR